MTSQPEGKHLSTRSLTLAQPLHLFKSSFQSLNCKYLFCCEFYNVVEYGHREKKD